jgi:hypothetical protein
MGQKAAQQSVIDLLPSNCGPKVFSEPVQFVAICANRMRGSVAQLKGLQKAFDPFADLGVNRNGLDCHT